jgi:hypothetical protein
MEILFWGSAIAIGYVYAGYPLLLAAWARLRGRPPAVGQSRPRDAGRASPSSSPPGTRPAGCRRAFATCLRCLIPAQRNLVVSDGSTDGTRAALAPFASVVRLIELPPGGKPRA